MVGAQSKAWVCGRSLAGVPGSNPAWGMDVCLGGVCCQVKVSATGRSLAQSSPTDCLCLCVVNCSSNPLQLQ